LLISNNLTHLQVKDKAEVLVQFLFNGQNSLLCKLLGFIFCDVISLFTNITIYWYLNLFTNGGFSYFLGVTLYIILPEKFNNVCTKKYLRML
jgi:uncharacterized membrane protein